MPDSNPDPHTDPEVQPDAEVQPDPEVRTVSRVVPANQRIGGGASRWAVPGALLIAVVAVAVAIWALVSASSKAPAVKLAGDAKSRVCTAFDVVTTAVQQQTHMNLGPDPVSASAVAGNARLALFGGGQYLLNNIDSATPTQLAGTVRSFANELQEIGMNSMAGVANSDATQASRIANGDALRVQIVELCK